MIDQLMVMDVSGCPVGAAVPAPAPPRVPPPRGPPSVLLTRASMRSRGCTATSEHRSFVRYFCSSFSCLVLCVPCPVCRSVFCPRASNLLLRIARPNSMPSQQLLRPSKCPNELIPFPYSCKIANSAGLCTLFRKGRRPKPLQKYKLTHMVCSHLSLSAHCSGNGFACQPRHSTRRARQSHGSIGHASKDRMKLNEEATSERQALARERVATLSHPTLPRSIEGGAPTLPTACTRTQRSSGGSEMRNTAVAHAAIELRAGRR